MKSFRIALILSLALAAQGCSDDDNGTTNTGADTGVATDTGSTDDTGTADTGAADTSTTEDTGTTDGGSTDSEAPDTATPDTGTCGSVANAGAAIPEVAGTGSYPTPTGGAVADGIYELVKHEIYPPGSVDPFTRKQAIRIAGSNFEYVSEKNGGGEERFSGTFATSGTTLTLTATCPGSGSQAFGYSATATELKLLESDGTTTNEVFTFKKK